MNFKMIGRFCAQRLGVEAASMIPAMIIGFCDGDVRAGFAFLIGIAIAGAVSGVLALLSKGAKNSFFAREGLICVGVGWILMSLIGCLPFVISGDIPNYIDALFEMISGFTTTGASILTDVESLTRASLYWRSFSHFLGGMGVLVFVLAIAPAGGSRVGYTMHLLRAESPGPEVGKLVPKMRLNAIILYVIYVALTVADFIFLVCGGVSVFEAVCIAYGTAGTGGFSVINAGMAGYSHYVQTVTAVFLLLYGTNFNIYYLLLIRRFKSVLKDEELHVYIGIVIVSITLIVINTFHMFSSFAETLHHSFFQVASILTTAGFTTVDFNEVPGLTKTILLLLMVSGACAGSTGGGIKVARIILLIKNAGRSLRNMMHPQRVETVRLSGRSVDEKVISATNAYLALYILLFIISFIIISFDGNTIETNFSAVLACMNNIGPGFGRSFANMAFFGPVSKIVLSVGMLAGRLELYPILVLFIPATWKHQ